MSPDAKLRMDVYQEGRSAFFKADVRCPYKEGDWRHQTWLRGWRHAVEHGAVEEPNAVPCGICYVPTRMTGTKRCDRCWELETRIRSNPDLARQILDSL